MNTSVDIENYERKSENRKEYVHLLQSYAEKKIDPSTIYESFIKEYSRLLDDFIDLKNNFITSKNDLPLQPSTSPSSSTVVVPTSPKLLPPQDPVADPSLPQKSNGQTFPKPSFKPAAKLAVVAVPNHDANPQYQRPFSRYSSTVSLSNNANHLENQRSFIVTDLPESTSFDPIEKRKSDMADVNRILNYLQINVEIHKCFRFTPKMEKFPADRPPFIKVIVANEEEKKKVVDAGNANQTKIRLLDNKYAAITIRDAIKSGNGQNGGHGKKTRSTATSLNYAGNTPSWNSSRSSFLESAQSTKISSNSSQSSYPLSPRPLNSIKFDQQPITSTHSDAVIHYTKGRSEDIYSSDEE